MTILKGLSFISLTISDLNNVFYARLKDPSCRRMGPHVGSKHYMFKGQLCIEINNTIYSF